MAARRRNRQPYAWLGAGALTFGLGAAMVSGAAVAVADSGPDSTAGTDTASSAPRGSATAHRTTAVRTARPSGAAAKAPAASAIRSTLLTAASPSASVSTPARPAAAASQRRASRSVIDPAAAASSNSATSSSTGVTAPAATAPFPDSPPSPFLPATPIVPGSAVSLSLQQISEAQTALNQATFGTGNLLAGVASVVPQLFLAEAALSLNAWDTLMPVSQNLVAATAAIPVLHQIAQAAVLASMTLPSFAGIGFGGASLFLPVVSALGANVTTVSELVGEARSNGQVYAIVPVTVKAQTEPTINIRINSGPSTSVLVDTGSSGLLVTRDYVGTADLGAPTGRGQVVFSGGTETFNYPAYNLPVDFGGGAVTGPTTVFIVDDADAAAYKAFLQPAGVVGILGTGADTNGAVRYVNGSPVSDPVPTSVLPGELRDGHLLYPDLFFGLLGGVMIFGPNPFPTRVSTPGVGYAPVKVSINGGAQQDVTSILDTGGVYGTLPNNLISLQVGSIVPNGTTISVYSPTGVLLYSYTTANGNGPDVVNGTIDNPPSNPLEPMNSGYFPFSQGPVYFNYGAPGGYGSTDFAIW